MRLILTLAACLTALATLAGDGEAQLLRRRATHAPACPVMGPGCPCGCEQTGLCSCSSPPANSPCPDGVCAPETRVADAKAPQGVLWCPDADKSGDYGLWAGDQFRGRLSRGLVWRPYVDGKYQPPCDCPYQLPAALRPVAYYQPQAYPVRDRINYFFGGGCAGGRCH